VCVCVCVCVCVNVRNAAAKNKQELIEKFTSNRENTLSTKSTPINCTLHHITTPRYPIAVLVFTYARPQYLRRCLDTIFKWDKETIPNINIWS
jgi:hypothetical protein